MRDISARELKGHNILAVERFQDSTRWMIEFSVQRPCSYGCPGDDMRLFGAFFLWRQYAEAGMAAAFIDDVYGRSFFCRVVSKPLFSEKQAGPLRKIPVLPNFFFPLLFCGFICNDP